MAFDDLGIVSFLKTKMNWHQARQKVLAHNVAHADTPDFKPSDLKPLRSKPALAAAGLAPVAAARTDPVHFAAALSAGDERFGARDRKGWEMTPAGNAVVLEEQMMKVSANQFDYQLASTLYSRSLGMLRTALGRN